MARDRQRAKQRRSKQPGARGSAARAARPRTGSTPTPDPLEHAFPDAEEARLAEAGATPPGVDDDLPEFERDEDFERAPDDLERDRDLASASSVRHEAERDPAHRAGRGRLLTFLGHVVDELRRVQWPDRRQVGQGTLVTLIFVLVAGGYLGLLDALWQPVIDWIL